MFGGENEPIFTGGVGPSRTRPSVSFFSGAFLGGFRQRSKLGVLLQLLKFLNHVNRHRTIP